MMMGIIMKISCSRSQVFFKIGVPKNFADFTGKHFCLSFFLIKLQALSPATLLKTVSKHRFFPMKFANFSRTPFS